jgi:hypothetical protein
MIKELLGDALGDFTIKNDNIDYRYRGDSSIHVQSIVLRTMKYELWGHSSNPNAKVMLVDLEALFSSQVRIMKYVYLDKFFFN